MARPTTLPSLADLSAKELQRRFQNLGFKTHLIDPNKPDQPTFFRPGNREDKPELNNKKAP